MSRHICTIIAKNYLSFARALNASFLQHHPDGRCYVLIIDEFDGYIDPSQENFEVVSINDLDIKNFNQFCFKYNVTELATAVKPKFLEHILINNDIERLLYLDPDILVTFSLKNLYEILDRSDVILTPHLDKDYPNDGLMPNDSHIMKSGIFNLGFIGIRKCENVLDFLKWWDNKLFDKCIIDPCSGYFVDQKFIDLAMVLFPNITVIYETGYNVAYWNIHSRTIHRKNSKWLCNEGPLYFYHFSNYKPEKPNVLSGYQTRFSLKNMPQLCDLFMFYTNLLNQNGYEMSRNWPYSYMHYSNGKIIKDVDRKVYRKQLSTEPLENPFNRELWPIKLKINVLKQRIINLIIKSLNTPNSVLTEFFFKYISTKFTGTFTR